MEKKETNISKLVNAEQNNNIQIIENNKISEQIEDKTGIDKRLKIKYGDLVIVFESRDSIKYTIINQGERIQNKYGSFKHDNIVGKSFGSKIMSQKGDSYITILSFLTNLWERSISRLTQILFNPDISLVMSFLNIKSNSIIYESGTGSGCLSTNMSQVLKNGHLYTFEFNQERATKLTSVFKMVGFEDRVTVTHRDVVENGFSLDAISLKKSEHKYCDGIFIDLPTPWLIVDKAKNVLKKGGNFVSFSPCMEQITKTMDALRNNGFINPRMFEIMYRSYNCIKTVKVSVPALSSKRKLNEEIPRIEKQINLSGSRIDSRGHTGFLIHATNN